MIYDDIWKGCYEDSWTDVIVPDAFAHPAKFSRSHIHRIYQHCKEEGWLKLGDTVFDPFAGVALGALDCIAMGCNWIGIELEQKFVDLAKQNINKWKSELKTLTNLGNAKIIQGDSRNLEAILKQAKVLNSKKGSLNTVISSPPYSATRIGGIDSMRRSHDAEGDYGQSEGQLGAMKEGKFDQIISSPRFQTSDLRNPSKGTAWKFHGDQNYGNTDMIISSPPYVNIATGAGGLNTKAPRNSKDQSGRNPKSPSQNTNQRYGTTRGNLANVKEGKFDCVVSSPPYEAVKICNKAGTGFISAEKRIERLRKAGHSELVRKMLTPGNRKHSNLGEMEDYSDTKENLGNQSGDTFWSACRIILEQCYDILKPAGHAIFVCKDFVRKKKIVPFSQQWATLCEAVGFKLIHWHRASLVKHYGEQLTVDGKSKPIIIERKSFFRRLLESKGVPRIDFEDILCFVK